MLWHYKWKGFLPHFFEGFGIITKIFLQSYKNNGYTRATFICFFDPLGNELVRAYRLSHSAYFIGNVLQRIRRINSISYQDDMCLRICERPQALQICQHYILAIQGEANVALPHNPLALLCPTRLVVQIFHPPISDI